MPRVWTIHVAGGAHNNDAREVDEPGDGGAEQGFESRVVFLCRHAVDAGAVRDESCKVLEGLGKDAAAVVRVTCGYVAFDDARGSCTRCVNRCLGDYVVCPVGLARVLSFRVAVLAKPTASERSAVLASKNSVP